MATLFTVKLPKSGRDPLSTVHTNYLWCDLMNPESLCEPTEETRVEEKHALSAGAYTTTWLVMVTLSPPVAVIKQHFKTLSRVMLYSGVY